MPLFRNFLNILLWSLSAHYAYSALPDEPVLWEYVTGSAIYSSVTLGSDGVAYIGSGDSSVYAINTDGSLKWSYQTGDWVDSVPALNEDESVVYVGSWDNHLYALNTDDGSLVWSYETGNFVVSSPSIGEDGTIYFGSNDNFFYAINPDGTLKWEFFLEGTDTAEIQASSAIDEDGTIYFGAKNGRLYSLDSEGNLNWYYQVEAEDGGNGEFGITSSIAIDDEGNLYFGSQSGRFYSVDPSLMDVLHASGFDEDAVVPTDFVRWTHRLLDISADDEGIDSSPVVGPFGNVYYATREGYIIALDSDGVELWSLYVGDVFYSAPTVDSEGIVYIPSFFGNVIDSETQESEAVSGLTAINQDGEIIWEYSLVYGYIDSSMAMDDNGVLYLGASDGTVMAFDTGSGNTLARSEWPKLRGNREANGRYSLWTYDILVLSIPGNGGTVTGAGSYETGSDVVLEAVPEAGYKFVSWSGGVVGSENPITFTATEDLSIIAWFEESLPFSLNSAQLDDQWLLNDWFGVYYLDDNGWVYHGSLGWIYLNGSSSSLWVWFPEQGGWYWTESTLFPFLYSESASNWIYYNEEYSLFYHYGETEEWLDHP